MNPTSRENLTGHFNHTLGSRGRATYHLGKRKQVPLVRYRKNPCTQTNPIMLYCNAVSQTQEKYKLQYGAHNFHFLAIISDNGEGYRS